MINYDPEKALVVDFDDTLTLGKSSGGEYIPNGRLHMELRRLHRLGWHIEIFSAKGWSREGGVDENFSQIYNEIQSFCWIYEIPHHKIRLGKPPARYYIDDKGLHWEDFLIVARNL